MRRPSVIVFRNNEALIAISRWQGQFIPVGFAQAPAQALQIHFCG
jgi:hypothetical protein